MRMVLLSMLIGGLVSGVCAWVWQQWHTSGAITVTATDSDGRATKARLWIRQLPDGRYKYTVEDTAGFAYARDRSGAVGMIELLPGTYTFSGSTVTDITPEAPEVKNTQRPH